MKFKPLPCAAVGAVFFLITPSIAPASSPTVWVQGAIHEVRSTLSGQEAGVGLTHEQRREMSRVFGKCFNFPEMARMALGRHWQPLSQQQRREFVHLFRKLLEQSHLWKMSTHAGVEQHYVGEDIDNNRAVVEALVKAKDSEIPIDYFLVQHNGAWKIYDVGVDGVRLSRIYRSQFNKVILKTSFDDLLRKMSLKLEEVAMEAAVQK